MKLLRIPQVAARLDITPARAYEMIRLGLLPSVRLGRQVRVDPTQLEEFIAAGGTTATQLQARDC